MFVKSRVLSVLMTGTALLLAASASAPRAAWANDADTLVFGKPILPANSPWGTKPAAGQSAVAPAGAFVLSVARPAPVPVQADAGSAAGEPNLSALRFYASQNDLARVAAEIRLLRAKYPTWEPPTDLFTDNGSGESEQALWDLFSKHDFQGLKAAIADRERQTPGWKPSSDLSNKLALALAYEQLVQASNAKDYGTVLDVGAANPGLLTCGNLDAIWRSAEALVSTGDEPHAIEAYRYVLINCPTGPERLATVQKASAILTTPGAVDALIQMGRRLPNGTNEFADLRFDAMRRRVGEALAAKQPVPAADIEQLAVRAHAANGAKDAELLGWAALAQHDTAGAETWFREALRAGPSPKAAEGLVLSLRDGGKSDDAVALARQYASLGPANQKVMVDVLVANLDGKTPLPADALAALPAAIDAVKAADAAQAYGWHQFKTKAVAEAHQWFRKSLDWQPSESAAVGLIVTAKQLKQQAEVASAVAHYSATYPRVAELAAVMTAAERPRKAVRVAVRHRGSAGGKGDGWDGSATTIVDTFQNGHVDQALAMMDARRASHAEPKGLSVVRGWALYKRGDWEGARQVFNDLDTKGMHDEASKGLRQIELGYTSPRLR